MARTLFKSPEIKELSSILLEQILNESGRGALLIATAHVEEFLNKLIIASLPQDYSNNKKKTLLDFPGVLSSFSAKIEILHAFRFINDGLYESLTELRKVRNEAAHSKKSIELYDLNERMEKVYRIGNGFLYLIKERAMTILISYKLDGLKKIFDEHDVPNEKRKEKALELLTKPEYKSKFEKQLPIGN